MARSGLLFLSPSSLNLFLDCERCFWLEKKGLKRPRGIFPSLPGGMDRVIKTYMDTFRVKGKMPAELSKGGLEGISLFADRIKLEQWRNWRTGLRYQDPMLGAILSGALDDLLVKDGLYIPFDYKTKGSMTTQEDAERYYQNQLDCYGLLLRENNMPLAGYAFLAYFSPKQVQESGQVNFEVQLIRLSIDPERAKETMIKAVALINSGQPPPNPACEYCKWISNFQITADWMRNA